MIRFAKRFSILLAVAGLAAGCDGDAVSVSLPAPGAAPQVEQPRNYLLTAEPAEAKGVIDVRKDSKNGDEVVVVGRIGGSKKPIVVGRLAFTIVDLSLEPCECEDFWVYCCTPREELLPAMVLVKCVDGQGTSVKGEAPEVLGVHEGNTVVVRGHAKRDGEGNLTAVEADGLYVRP